MSSDWLFRHRRAVLAAASAVFVAAGVLAGHLGFARDVMALLPRDDPVVGDYLQVLGLFERLDQALVDVSQPGQPFSRDTIAVAEAMARRVADSALVSGVRTGIGLDELAAAHHELSSHRQSLFSESMAEAVKALIRGEAIADRLDQVRRQITEFPDPVTVEMFTADPLGLDQLLLELIPSPAGAGDSAQVVEGRLWSADGEHLLMLVEPATGELEGGRAAEFVKLLETAAAAAQAEIGATGVRVARMSRYRAALANERTVRGDVARTLWISLIAISLLLLAFFTRLRLVPLLFLPPLFGGACAVGALFVVFGQVSPVIVGCGSILLGISIDYAIHLLYRLEHGETARGLMAATAKPIILAAATTGIAFLSLLASSLPGHRQLGVFAAAGVVSAALGALLVLPLLVPRLTAVARPAVPVAGLVGSLLAAIAGRRRLVLALLVVISLALFPGLDRVTIESDLARFNALDAAAIKDSRLIVETWGSPLGHTSLAVFGATLDQALARSVALAEFLAGEVEAGRVDSYQSVTGLLPDEQTQIANRQVWSEFWSPQRVGELEAEFQRLMIARGFAPAAVAGFWASLGQAGEALTYEGLAATSVGQILAGWIAAAPAGGKWVLTRCSFAPSTVFAEQSERLRQVVPDLVVGDGQQSVRRLSAIVYQELKRMSLLSFGLVFLVLVPFFRDLRRPLVLVSVLAVTFYWTLAILGLLGITISLMNCMLAIFIFGLTVDYSIFLLHAHQATGDKQGVAAAAVVLSSLTTLLGFGALLAAKHPSLTAIGSTTLVGIACGLTAALTLVPSLMPMPAPASQSQENETASDSAE